MSEEHFDEGDKEVHDYSHSRGFHLYLVTENRDLLDGCNRILRDCFLPKEINTRKRIGAARKVMRRLVMSLYKEWAIDPTKFITISLNRNDWAKGGRYEKLRIPPDTLSTAVHRLHERGYIHLHLGEKKWNPKDRKQTRMAALPPLIEAIHQSQQQGNEVQRRIQFDGDKYLSDSIRPRTVLKDKNKKPMAILRKPSDVVEGELLLEKYQGLLNETFIFSPSGEEATPYDKFQYRVFSNGTFDHNGRIHGGFWQTMPKKQRGEILLDFERTVEIDIKATFPVIVYHFLEIDYWNQFANPTEENPHTFDPYSLEGYTDREPFGGDYRNILKIVFNSAINTTNTGRNLGWITKLVREMLKKMLRADPPEISPEAADEISQVIPDLINKFLFERHHLLKDYFFDASIGMLAMNVESRVAMKVIEEFVRLRKPVLTIFDSFIVKEEDRLLLSETIVNAYWNTLGFTPFLTRII